MVSEEGRHADQPDWMSERDVESVSATEAKNLFGSLLDKAIGGKKVVITRRDRPKAVLVGFEEFESLTRGDISTLSALSEAFDARLAAMQTAEAKAATKKAFGASPSQLGKAAAKAARRSD